jgi:hypothetical protein
MTPTKDSEVDMQREWWCYSHDWRGVGACPMCTTVERPRYELKEALAIDEVRMSPQEVSFRCCEARGQHYYALINPLDPHPPISLKDTMAELYEGIANA